MTSLASYVQHHGTCTIFDKLKRTCDCGLSKALAATPAFEINPFANEPPVAPAVGGDENPHFTTNWLCRICNKVMPMRELICRGDKPFNESLACPHCGSTNLGPGNENSLGKSIAALRYWGGNGESDSQMAMLNAADAFEKFFWQLAAQPASPLREITDEMVNLACEVYAEVYHDDDKDMGDAMRAALKAVSPTEQPAAAPVTERETEMLAALQAAEVAHQALINHAAFENYQALDLKATKLRQAVLSAPAKSS